MNVQYSLERNNRTLCENYFLLKESEPKTHRNSDCYHFHFYVKHIEDHYSELPNTIDQL